MLIEHNKQDEIIVILRLYAIAGYTEIYIQWTLVISNSNIF